MSKARSERRILTLGGLARRSLLPLGLILLQPASFAQEDDRPPADPTGPGAAERLETLYISPGEWVEALREGVERGLIDDPESRPIPVVAPRQEGTAGPPRCLTREHVFPFEDTSSLLLTNFDTCQLFALMTDAANALLTAHGDNYDFIGYFLSFAPANQIGAAFYAGIENEVTGIGDPSTVGTPQFDFRPCLGLAGSNVEGYIMMWQVDGGFWAPGAGNPGADQTRLVLGQEFEHRFAMFLPDLLDGRMLQGDNSSCGRVAHWNFKVDGQGSSMEIAEWTGSSPAIPTQLNISFNTDIPGSVWSYTDLYLMGYVSPAEMDAGNSELRYMDTSSCFSNYNGNISTFSSADIIASAGVRVPDSTAAQKDFRCGWIMLHLPGQLPTNTQLDLAVGILEQQQLDWRTSTLDRGTLDNSLFTDINCNGVPDSQEPPTIYCTGKTNSLACVPFVTTSGTPSVTSTDPFPVTANDLVPSEATLMVYGSGRASLSFHAGKLCVKSPLTRLLPVTPAKNGGAPPCSGMLTKNFNKRIQSGADPSLTAGHRVNGQFIQRDPADPSGFGDTLTNGIQFVIAP